MRAAIAGLVLLASASDALAGDVSGRITIDPPARPAAKTAAPTPADKPATPPRAFVFVERVEPPAGGFAWPAELDAPRIEMRSLAFVPREIAVRAGGTVAFENADDLFHQPFSCSRGNRFDLGRFRKGESPAASFPEPGVARVYCDVHSGMRAFVLVVQNPFVAPVAPDGAFRLAGVPAGRRRIAVVLEGDVLDRREVDVPEDGGAAPPPIEWRVAAGPASEADRRVAGVALPAPCCARR